MNLINRIRRWWNPRDNSLPSDWIFVPNNSQRRLAYEIKRVAFESVSPVIKGISQ